MTAASARKREKSSPPSSCTRRTLAELGGFLLELLNGTLVDSTALVDQVAGGGRLAGIDVADNDDVNVKL